MNTRHAQSPPPSAQAAPFPRSLLPAFGAALRQERAELQLQLRGILTADEAEISHVPGSEGSSDTKDLAARDVLADQAADGAAHLRQRIAAVNAALARLDRDTFAVCTHCGQSIPVKRLYAQPTAARCTSCQEHSEHTAIR